MIHGRTLRVFWRYKVEPHIAIIWGLRILAGLVKLIQNQSQAGTEASGIIVISVNPRLNASLFEGQKEGEFLPVPVEGFFFALGANDWRTFTLNVATERIQTFRICRLGIVVRFLFVKQIWCLTSYNWTANILLKGESDWQVQVSPSSRPPSLFQSGAHWSIHEDWLQGE